MSNKLYEESSIRAIADAIRSKLGGAKTYKVSEMADAVREIHGSSVKKVEWHQCPEKPMEFVANVTYDPTNYAVSMIENYAPDTPQKSNQKPIGYTIDGITFYNEEPNAETIFQSEQSYGTVKPLDQLRYINTPSAPNVRDIGGWKCDGGTVKYGMLFRGGFLSLSDRDVLVNELGVRHDLDLRGTSEAGITESPIGSDVHYTCASAYNWYSVSNNEAWRTNIRCVFDAIAHNEPVYFHCTAGADRTGTLACVLEGLLGMNQSDIDKDYELTCFYSGTSTDSLARRRNESEWSGLINQINTYGGETFRDRCVSFVATLGFTAEEINAYRKGMINGTPEEIALNVATYNVVNVLSNVTIDNDKTSTAEYQPYNAKINVPIGYVIESIKVKMGSKDITTTSFKGTPTNLKWAVNVVADNCNFQGKKAVIDGQDFVATVEANIGYAINTITIKMGGADMSDYYSDGKISIPNVTGDIEITVTAVKSASEYTNQVVISVDENGDIFNGKGYIEDKRIKSSGALTELDGGEYYNPIVTGYIPIKAGDVIRFQNAYMLKRNQGSLNIFGYIDISGTAGTSTLFPITSYRINNESSVVNKWDMKIVSVGMSDDAVVEMTVPDTASLTDSSGRLTKYMRFSLERPTADAVPIITINEEIV